MYEDTESINHIELIIEVIIYYIDIVDHINDNIIYTY